MTKTHWRLAKRLAVYGSYLLLTVVVSSPFVSIRNLGARSVSGGDVGRDLWCMSWVNHALKHHPLDLFQAHIFHPHKNALAFSEHFVGGAVLVFPWFLFSENPVYPFNFLFLVSYLWIWGERSTYVGYTVLIPAALGMYFLLRRKWDRGTSQRFVTYVSLGLFAFLVSLGPYFLDLGGMVSPSRLLYWIIPPLVSLRAIARLAIVVMFCLAVLTALVVAQFRHRTNLMVIPLLGSLFLFEHFPVGLPWNPGEAHPFQARPVDLWLKEHASEQDALLELPGYSEQDWTREALYMVYSTQHWLRLVNGLARFYPPGYIEDQKIFATFPADEALELLKRHGVDYVIVHANQVPGEQLAALKNHPELKPAAVFGEDLLFRIQD